MNRTRPIIIYPWHPEHLNHKNPLIIEDLLEMHLSKQICAQKCKQMIGNLSQNGLESRYRKHLGGALWELKDRTSDGGARVYFLHGTENRFFIVTTQQRKLGISTSPRNTLTKPAQTLKPCLRKVEM